MDIRLDDDARRVLDAVLAQHDVGLFVTDAAGGCREVDDRWCEITGLERAAALDTGWISALHPDDRADVVGASWFAEQTDADVDHRVRFRQDDGTHRRVRLVATRVLGLSGETHGWVGTVTAGPESPDRQGLGNDLTFLRAALANSSDLVVVVDAASTLTYVSAASERMLGRQGADWIGRSVFDLIHPDDASFVAESLITTLEAGSGVREPIEVRALHADGSWRHVEILGNNLLGDPAVAGILISARDISERWQAQRRENRARRRFEQAFNRSPIGMALTTIEGRFVRVNQAMCDLLGMSAAQLLETSALEATHPEDLERTIQGAVDLLEDRSTSFSLEKRFLTSDGSSIWTRATVTLLRDDDNEPLHFLTQVENIEERRHLMANLRQSALVDSLTGLANRAGLHEYLSCLPGGTVLAVLALDLDRFKQVNDTAGHAAGDEVLREVARCIRSTIRPDDVAARIGGDEFVVIYTMPPSSEVLVGMGTRLLGAISRPIAIGDTSVEVGASAGFAVGFASDSADLLVRADIASYRAKRLGGNRVLAAELGA